MIFKALSPKQKEVFRWCHGKKKDRYDALICDGAVRSGKTICMVASFVIWAMRYFDNQCFAICGKTVTSAERNIVNELLKMEDITSLFCVEYKRLTNCLTITNGKKTNLFYVFGGRDESSAALIQGMTLAGVLLDEVVLMPRSFVEQAIARCSVAGSKFWFSCNPAAPSHWFKTEWIDKKEDKKALHLHFGLTDNPSLSDDIIARYKHLYSGIFYQRFIQGLWVAADGLVYDVSVEDVITSDIPQIGRYFVSIDYGTQNPFSAGLWCLDGLECYRLKEYYYSGKTSNKQLTDEEYYQAILDLTDGYNIEKIVIDPSAASMIACIKKHGKFAVKKAKNDVIDGIRTTSAFLKSGRIKISPECKDWIRELGQYRWDDKKNTDTVIKENDHAMDDTRYMCYTILAKEWKYL